MKNVITSTLLTLAAVPFLMAAPNAAKKVQNQNETAKTTKVSTVKKTHKAHAKKNAVKPASETAAPVAKQ